MQELRIFENEQLGKIRTTIIDGVVYFVGKDVAEILGYSNPRKALSDHVDDEDKGVTKCDTLGGVQDLTIINESGLYSLILSSKLPKAKEVKKWLFKEVLPKLEELTNTELKIVEPIEEQTNQANIKMFEGHRVEVIEINGQVLFNPYDVAKCLDIKNVRDSIKDFNSNQVIKLTNSIVGNTDFRKLHNTGENFLTESGVYKLVFRSRKPNAEKFTDWIADEVLPSIRQTGNYSNQPKLPMTYKDALKQLLEQVERNEQLELENKQKEEKIQQDAPKVSYYDTIINCTDLIPITMIAKDYGWSAIKMNKYLEQKRVQYKFSDTWLLYDEYASKGYTSSKTIAFKSKTSNDQHSKMYTCWTQKGRLFLYELLKQDGILPLIEKA